MDAQAPRRSNQLQLLQTSGALGLQIIMLIQSGRSQTASLLRHAYAFHSALGGVNNAVLA